MKRNFKIISIILLFIIALLLGAWLISRKKAIKNNVPPLTFRSFLGIGSSSKPKSSPGNELSSDFKTEQKTESVGVNKKDAPPVRTSIFTNAGLNPVGSLFQNNNDQIGVNNTPGNGTTTGASNVSPVITPVAITPQQPECSDADLSIEFTTDEIDRLNVLKSKFFALAESLNTDADLATEISNYDLFKSKSDKLTELYNYCRQSPVYTQARATTPAPQQYGTAVVGPNGDTINYRVPTPFWHDLTKDNEAFIHQGINWKGVFSDPDSIFPERSIEHALRLNLW